MRIAEKYVVPSQEQHLSVSLLVAVATYRDLTMTSKKQQTLDPFKPLQRLDTTSPSFIHEVYAGLVHSPLPLRYCKCSS